MVIIKDIIRTYYACGETAQFDVDEAISRLAKVGVLTEVELVVLMATKEQYSLILIGEMIGLTKSAIARNLDSACKKIAKFLGPEYQDEKILKCVEVKLGRKLTPDEEFFCWKKIRDFGRNKYSNINIFNFKIKKGKIVGLTDDKAER